MSKVIKSVTHAINCQCGRCNNTAGIVQEEIEIPEQPPDPVWDCVHDDMIHMRDERIRSLEAENAELRIACKTGWGEPQLIKKLEQENAALRDEKKLAWTTAHIEAGEMEAFRKDLEAAKAENAALKAEKDKLALDAIEIMKWYAADLERMRNDRDEAHKRIDDLRDKLERAERALKGIPHNHFIEDKAVGICCGCIADRYFEEKAK